MIRRLLVALLILTGLSACAGENYLNTVVMSQTDGAMSVILRTDELTKISKSTEGTDRLTLTLKDTKQSNDMSTIYKNISDVDGLLVQNFGNNLKIYIESKDIAKAKIVFETPDSAPVVVTDNIKNYRFLWCLISIVTSFVIMMLSKFAVNKRTKRPNINELIKEREKKLYKDFQKEVATLPSMNYKLKNYRKHVLKGETLRSYNAGKFQLTH